MIDICASCRTTENLSLQITYIPPDDSPELEVVFCERCEAALGNPATNDQIAQAARRFVLPPGVPS